MPIKSISHLSRLLLCCVCIFCSAGIAHAKEPKWYQIEVLLFAQQPEYQRSGELWLDRFQPDYSNHAITLNPDEESRLENNLADDAFKLLPDAERTLKSAAQRIKASADLRLLSHLAWRQPLPGREEAQAIQIQTGKQFNSEFELEGTISISRDRYLHARTDLFFSKFEPMKSRQQLDWTIFEDDQLDFGQRDWNAEINKQAATATQFVRSATANLKQSRRMRSEELHYIDHPLFGMLIQITPYKLPDPAMDLLQIPLLDLPAKRPLPDSAISPNL